MKSLIRIRPAKNHDVKRIYEFLCEKEEQLFDFAIFENNYRICIGDIKNIYLVAADELNMATGFISCHGQTVLHRGRMIYEMGELFIDKKYRKAGIGKMLLKELQVILEGKNYEYLQVAVMSGRSDLIQFYKSAGFEITHLKLIKSKRQQ